METTRPIHLSRSLCGAGRQSIRDRNVVCLSDVRLHHLAFREKAPCKIRNLGSQSVSAHWSVQRLLLWLSASVGGAASARVCTSINHGYWTRHCPGFVS